MRGRGGELAVVGGQGGVVDRGGGGGGGGERGGGGVVERWGCSGRARVGLGCGVKIWYVMGAFLLGCLGCRRRMADLQSQIYSGSVDRIGLLSVRRMGPVS